MLHTETVEPGTFSLLKRLMALPALQNFSLVGGTALALKYGHRSSVDLDLFNHQRFDQSLLIRELESSFGNRFVYKQQHTQFGCFCFIEEIKVDFVYYPHLPLKPPETEKGIRYYSIADIAAMKIQAILGRGKKKDFWDLFELLLHYDLQQIMDWHKEKFPGQMLAISIPHAITYFVDADSTEAPVSFRNQSWESVKNGIRKAVREYLQ